MRTTIERLVRGTSPITTALLISWLRIDAADESATMMQMIIDNATDICQEYCGRSLMACQYRKQFSGDIKFNLMLLPYPYIDTIDKFVWIDVDGVETAIADYHWNIEGDLHIEDAPYVVNPERISCEYTTRPLTGAMINTAILRVAEYLYEKRGDCPTSDEIVVRSGAASILAPYRRVIL